MDKTVIALFDTRQDAENAAYELRSQNLRMDDISIVAKDGAENNTEGDQMTNDNISDGVTTGSVLGGLAGLLIGAGSFVVPGLGVIAAAGPIAGLLSGAITGGIVGGLIDLGIPESATPRYEQGLREGKVILTTKATDENVDAVTDILKNFGGFDVEVH
ncbi:general stress protein [Defluviitalea saccharophila]|uniref:General stress protein 17M-like domain-containing protein n=1 Tax=Defluviitalea saccharophila TaxID=879970 RepID=A0ABZ2Y3C0_9FIRM|nr:DUF1269 domain-containing protein [Candidatus Epulonipiscium sp.]